MKTCGESFSHIIADVRPDKHSLVTHGIYKYIIMSCVLTASSLLFAMQVPSAPVVFWLVLLVHCHADGAMQPGVHYRVHGGSVVILCIQVIAFTMFVL
jgi:hypothetical protein